MNIAWVMTDFDPSNPKKHSYGIGWFIVEYLRNAGHHVDVLGGYGESLFWFFKAKQLLFKIFTSKVYLRHREIFIHKFFAKKLKSDLKKTKYDFILSFGSLPVALIDTDIPVFFWADATFDSLVNYYPEYSRLSDNTYKSGHFLEQQALHNSTAAFFSSEWAINTARKNYNINSSKLFFIPFGANFFDFKGINIDDLINAKSMESINFLFNGRDWQRKNGAAAIEVVRLLNSKGLKAQLHIIGVDSIPENIEDFIVLHGFINKAEKQGREKMFEIYKNTHFLLHIPYQDCTPHVLNEANAYAIPCIVTNTGGIPSLIRQNINGLLYDLPLNLENIADDIIKIVNDSVQYVNLAKSSYDYYLNNLNWDVNINRLLTVIEEKLKNIN
jgi:glycosyltransferase involved in cell wall biosynthesis